VEETRNPEYHSERPDDHPAARVRDAERAAGPQVDAREHRTVWTGRLSAAGVAAHPSLGTPLGPSWAQTSLMEAGRHKQKGW
jgi:hypothetical protein